MQNVNVAILGHIDSGKTALARALTEVASTAALDKNPQSQERGITLDLGLSSFFVASEATQVTLVDCPGHASLIRAVLGAAQIVDLAILVVDVNKGVQTQTAECVVVAEVAIPKLVVVLNKIDQLAVDIDAVTNKLRKIFTNTKFGSNLPILPISAHTGAGVDTLKQLVVAEVGRPERKLSGNLLFLYDHCFGLKGQGTVLTGTVVEGAMRTGDTVNIPPHGNRKIKSMQSFRQTVTVAGQGDRVGICVTNLDASDVERGIVTKENSVSLIQNAVVSCTAIKYFKAEIKSKQKFHVTLGHDTVLASFVFLRRATQNLRPGEAVNSQSFEYSETFTDVALMQLERPVVFPLGKIFLASKLDLDIQAPGCRVAFHGNVLEIAGPNFRASRTKEKQGVIEKSDGGCKYIVKDLLKKDSDASKVIGNPLIHAASGETGTIDGTFGKTGKLRVTFKSQALQGIVLLRYTKILKLL